MEGKKKRAFDICSLLVITPLMTLALTGLLDLAAFLGESFSSISIIILSVEGRVHRTDCKGQECSLVSVGACKFS